MTDIKSNQIELVKTVNKLYYEIEAESYDNDYCPIFEGDFHWWDYVGDKYIKNFFRSSQKISLLDIGSGTGFVVEVVLRYLKKEDKVFCYDISPGMIEYAKRKFSKNGINNIDFIVGDLDSELPFENESIDIITCNSVLHHIPKLDVLSKEVDRILKKSGLFIAGHEPNKCFFDSFFNRFLATLYREITGWQVQPEIVNKINAKLKEMGFINKDISRKRISSLIEFNSPTEQEFVDKDKGLSFQELHNKYFRNYSILEYKEYVTFFHRKIFQKNLLLKKTLENISKILLNNKGNLFGFVMKK